MNNDNLIQNKIGAETVIDQYITSIGKKIDFYHETSGFHPLPKSQASIELQSMSLKSILSNAFDFGHLLIINSGDHLVCLSRAIGGQPLSIASWAVARNVLEASSKSAWLLNPDLTPKARCNRFYSLHFNGLCEKEKFANDTGDSELIENAKKEKDKLIEKAKNDGFELIYNKKNKLISIGEKKIYMTDLAREQFDSAPLFRIFSGVLHNHIWATVSFGMKYSHTSKNGDMLYENDLTINSIFILATHSISVFHFALGRKFDLFGWDREIIDKIKDRSIQRLKDIYHIDIN